VKNYIKLNNMKRRLIAIMNNKQKISRQEKDESEGMD